MRGTLLLLFGMGLLGCGANVIFGSDSDGAGAGGSGDGGQPSNGGSPQGANGPGPGPGPGGGTTDDVSPVTDVTTNQANTFCDAIQICQGDGFNPESGCLECSIYGDSTVAVDGGVCAESYFSCFGSNGDCSDGDPDCCAVLDCVELCNEQPDFLDCVCTNDGSSCLSLEEQQPGTCIGDHPSGTLTYTSFTSCVFEDVCFESCQ